MNSLPLSQSIRDPSLPDLAANGPLLVVITGPSGVGKDSVVNRLKEIGPPCTVIVTVTTRPRRQTETHGVDYLFTTHDAYQRWLDADEFLEHAQVYGYGYGTLRSPVRAALQAGTDVVMRIDLQGAATIGRLVPGCIRIFLAPPSIEELEARLRNRRSETPEALAKRLAIARDELARAAECDYLVMNADGQLEAAVADIIAIMRAERTRIARPQVVV